MERERERREIRVTRSTDKVCTRSCQDRGPLGMKKRLKIQDDVRMQFEARLFRGIYRGRIKGPWRRPLEEGEILTS